MSIVLEAEASAKYPFKIKDGNDHRSWAKRILYRLERNDKDLLPIQIKFAQMAMGIQPEQGEVA